MSKTKQINPEELSNIIKLFNDKNWEIDEINSNSLYKRFLKTYISLKTIKEKNAFISLATKYEIVNLADYNIILLKILNSIFRDDTRKDILVFPLLEENNISRIKSSVFLCYLFKSVSINYYDNLSKKNFTIVETYDMLKKKKLSNKILFLVDDYIGSGTQCSDALDDIFNSINLQEVNQVYIISLYINQMGFDLINEKIKHYENVKLIYGYKTQYNIRTHEHILQSINIKDRDNTYKGYKDCGDLITLIRTPNNTIPLFRYKSDAPFPRK